MSEHRKTCRRYNNPGDAHALTFSCFKRQPFLSRDRSRQWLLDAIDKARGEHPFDVWAYVVMPEHAHLLIWPRHPRYNISKILATIKQSVARRALHFVEREAPAFLARMLDRQPSGKSSHRFWQRGGGYDRNVVELDTLWSEIEYFHLNPVRRGLCHRAVDWPWSSARDYVENAPGKLRINRDSLPWG
jgi:putative transposase